MKDRIILASNEPIVSQRSTSQGQPEPPALDLSTFVGILSRQYKLVLIITFLCLALAGLILSQLHRLYTADALLVIDDRESQLVGIDDTSQLNNNMNNQVDTEVEILGSAAIGIGVITRMKLWNDPEFDAANRFVQKLLSAIGISTFDTKPEPAQSIEEVPEQRQAQLIERLFKSIRISRVGATNVIAISATSRSPEKAAQLANTVLDTYLDLQIEARVKTAQRAAMFLDQRVNELAKSIQENDERIDRFVLAQGDKIGTPAAREEISRVREEIKRTISSQSDLALQIARLQTDGATLSAGSSLSADLKQLSDQRKDLMRQLEAKSDINLEAELQALNKQIQSRVSERVTDLSKQISGADTKVADLRKAVLDIVSHQEVPPDIATELYRLQRNAENGRRLYDLYAQRLGEVQQKANLALPNSRIVASAIAPHDSSFPPILLTVGLAIFGGLGLGATAATARERLIGGFASLEQLEALTNLPVLSCVPFAKGSNIADLVISAPFSAFTDSIRRLQTNLDSMKLTPGCNVIVVTSAEPNEGKSTIATCLARSFAMTGRKTLLLEGDLRKSSLAEVAGSQSPYSIIDILHSPTLSTDQILPWTGREDETGLHLITMPLQPEKWTQAIFPGIAQFDQLVTQARREFEIVIIDTPPIGFVSDAKLILRSADACLFVVKQNGPSQRNVGASLRDLLLSSESIPVAFVLSQVGSYYSAKKYNAYYSEP